MMMEVPETGPHDRMVKVLKSESNPASRKGDSDITLQLPNSIRFPAHSYEVALVSASYAAKKPELEGEEYSVHEKRSRVTKKKRKRVLKLHERVVPANALFPGYRPPEKKRVTYQKGGIDNLMNVVMNFNSTVGKPNNVELFVDLAGGNDRGVVRLEYKGGKQNKVLYLSKDLSNMLKLDRVNFPEGYCVGRDVVLPEDLKQFNLNVNLSFQMNNYTYTDDMIKYALPMQSLYVLNRVGSETYVNFFDRVVSKLRTMDFEISFTFNATKHITMNVVGKNPAHTKDQAIISSNLLELMGFEQDTFPIGSYTSNVPFNEEKFNQLASSTVMTMRLTTKEFLDLYMQEPKTTGVRDVISELNSTFQLQTKNQYFVQFYYIDGYIVLHEGDLPSDIEIELPPLVCKYFGITPGSKFSPGTKYETSADIIEDEEEEEFDDERGKVEPKGEPKKLLITSNVVKNQLYGNKFVGLLKEAELPQDDKNTTKVEPTNLMYMPTCCSELSYINISFLDEYLRPIKLQTPTSVTLDFKPTCGRLSV